MAEDVKTPLIPEELGAQFAAMLKDTLGGSPLPLPVQPVDDEGKPVGPVLTTWGEFRAHNERTVRAGARDALDEADAALANAAARIAQVPVREGERRTALLAEISASRKHIDRAIAIHDEDVVHTKQS